MNELFLNRMKNLLGEDYQKYIDSFKESPQRSFFLNKNKISPDEFSKISPFGNNKVPYADNSYYFDFEHIGSHPFHHAGMFYIQEPAAMFPVNSVEIKPDFKILDMCAAPGGKSLQAVQYLSDEGQIVSNEYVPNRCKILAGNFERLGVKNATVTNASSDKIASLYPLYFDLVIVDAPCSGEGMFRKEPVALSQWSEQLVEDCASRQKEILSNAVKCVNGQGYLLYSTCTFSLEENEYMIDWLIENYPNFKPIPLNEKLFNFTAPGVLTDKNKDYHEKCMRRFYPFISHGEGQFAALLQNTDEKSDTSAMKNSLKKPSDDILKTVKSFFENTVTELDTDNIFINKDVLFYFDKNKYVPNAPNYLCGVTVGTVNKNNIKPHHQFFSAFGNKFIRKINFEADDKNLDYYLRGGSFYVDCADGWCVVTVNGAPIGGAKIINGYLKNYYPNGLHNKI